MDCFHRLNYRNFEYCNFQESDIYDGINLKVSMRQKKTRRLIGASQDRPSKRTIEPRCGSLVFPVGLLCVIGAFRNFASPDSSGFHW